MTARLIRPLTLAATLAIVAGTSYLAASQNPGGGPPPQAPAIGIFDGDLEVVYEDFPGGSKLSHHLRVNGQRLELRFDAGDPPDLQTGQKVRARGRLDRNVLMLASSGDLQAMSPAMPNTFGEQKVAVILINFSDYSAQPYTAAAVSSVIFQSVNNFYRENSYQQTSLAGNVYGWYTIPATSATCDYYLIASQADQAATKAGVNLSQFTRKVYAFPQIGACGWWGLGTVGGNPSQAWINGSFEVQVVAHELGHNFGDYHSNSQPCEAAGCSMVEYGDDRDVMGRYAIGHLTAFQKERLGWLNYGASPPVQSVSQSGSYFLENYASLTPNTKALRMVKSVDAMGRRTWYYFEVRGGFGFDAAVAPGVVVHTGSEVTGNSSNQIDVDPASPAFDSTLDAGQTFVDTAAGLSVTTAWSDANGAMLNVLMDGPACAETAPTVSMSPSGTVSAAAATPVSFTLSVKNNDTNCGDASFQLSSAVPAGWSGVFGTPAVSVAPGATATASFTLTSAAGANGQFSFQANASRSGASGSVSKTVQILSSYTVSVSAAKAGNAWSLAATVLGAGAPVSGANVVFTVKNPLGAQRTLSAATGSNGVAKVKYNLTKNDPAGTYQVQAVATKGSLTGTAAGSFVK